MLSEALRFPAAGEDWLKTVLIGGVLSLLSFLIVPTIFVNGYLVRVLRAAIDGTESPPAFEEWVDLLVDGVLLWVVQLVYVGIPAFLLFVVVGSFAVVTTVVTSGEPGPAAGAGMAAGGILAVLVILALLLVLLAGAYLLPAALANFARTGDVVAAFHLGTVARAAFAWDYLVAVLLAIVVGVVLGSIGAMLSVILVGAFVLFYLQVVVYHLVGQGFARGLDLDGAAA